MHLPIFPIVLAGGSGTRLWPLSRKNFPKQFICLQGKASLLQETVERIRTLGQQKIILISNDAHYFLCQEQLAPLKNNEITYLLEPCGRNTAPAIACAAYYLLDTLGSDAIMLILPADHMISD